MIEITCSLCGKGLSVRGDIAGKKMMCPQCGAMLVVPQPVVLRAAPANTSQPVSSAANSAIQPATKRRRRAVVLMFLALIASPFVPEFPLCLGILMLILCITALVPAVQGFPRRLLRLNPRERWQDGLRLILYGFLGLVLIIAGAASAAHRAEQARVAAKQAEKDAEQRRLTKEANEQVVALVREAEVAWKGGKPALADEKLSLAERIPHATETASVSTLRAKMGNAKAASLVLEAARAARVGDIETAGEKVQEALAVPYADDLAEAKKLDEQIKNATDPDCVRAKLMSLTENAFHEMQETGTMPVNLRCGFEALDNHAADLAADQLADVAAARAQRREERLQRERAAAKAAQKAEEERKARLAAAAEARLKEARKKRIKQCFSGWDGSHDGLTKLIKSSMNDPKSYEHVETVYWDMDDHLIVRTKFRGKNVFGGVVLNWILAKVDIDGNVLSIIHQGP